jgi:hypothetical protein
MRKTLLASFAVLMTALPAAAQTGEPSKDQQPQNCQAQPDANDPAQKQKQEADADELSKQLDKCGGVLKPPPTGDKNAATPPSTGSDMPVIKPGEVPPQTPK